jgi:antiviral helicase SLH1
LCCTSTLAWGVNLPAHAVVIKGTQVYDAGKGSFVDLSILDVLQVRWRVYVPLTVHLANFRPVQIFGRAGRPGYETSGVGYICTTQDKLDHYLDAVLSQHPIESRWARSILFSVGMPVHSCASFRLVPGMVDAMNAEVSLGTISTVSEAIEWLGYTYLFGALPMPPFPYF